MGNRTGQRSGAPAGGRPALRSDTDTPLKSWITKRASKEKVSYGEMIGVLAKELERTRSYVYALANRSARPSQAIAAKLHELSKGAVDAAKSWA